MTTYEVEVADRSEHVIEALASLSDIKSVIKVERFPDHSFEVGDYALDDQEPTPSPEVNTVEVVELIDQRADEFVIEETGKTVAEHNKFYPPSDPVVAGKYPNMSSDLVYHFPESRLRKV